MKRSLKLTLVSVLSLICVFSLVISLLDMSSNKVQATQPELETFQLVDGAFIRDEAPIGLRFEAGISTAEKNTLTDAEFGMLITLDTHLGDGEELTFATSRKIDVKANNWRSASSFGSDYSGYFASLTGGTDGNLIDFEAEHYSDVFVARGYVKYNDGANIAYTSNTIERTLAGSVKMAKDAYVAAEQPVPALFDTILADANCVTKTLTYNAEGATDVPSQKTLYVGEVLDNDFNAKITKDDDLFGGWFYDQAFTQPAFRGNIIKDNTTVYGQLADTLTYGGDMLKSLEPSNDKYSYVKEDMSGVPSTDIRTNTYKFSHGDVATDVNGARLAIAKSEMGYAFGAGNYLVIDVYMASGDSSSRFYPHKVFEEHEGLYYIVDNAKAGTHLVQQCYWYKIVLPISDINDLEGVNYVSLSQDKKCTVYVSNVSLINAATYTANFKEETKPEPPDTGIYTFGLNVLVKEGSGVTYQFASMPSETPEEDVKQDTYQYVNSGSGGSYLTVQASQMNGKFIEGNYLVLDVYMTARPTTSGDSCRFRYFEVYEEGEDAYYIVKNEPYSAGNVDVQLNTWYKIVTPIKGDLQNGATSTAVDLTSSKHITLASGDDKACTVYVAGVSIYNAENYQATFKQEAMPTPSVVNFALSDGVIYNGHSSTANITYEAQVMPATTATDNVREGTYVYKKETSDIRSLYVNSSNAGDAWNADSYLVIDVYIEARSEASERLSSFTYMFDSTGELVDRSSGQAEPNPYGAALQTWYKVAIKIGNITDSKINMGDKQFTFYFSGVSIYTATGFQNAFPSAFAS